MTDPLSRVPGIWRPGMLTLQYGVSARLTGQDEQGRWNAWDRSGVWLRYNTMDGIEVATDDPAGATTGCLAAFCRGVWKLPDLYCRPLLPGGWVVGRPFPRPGIVFDDVHGPTEAAAWRNAILVHPSLRNAQ